MAATSSYDLEVDRLSVVVMAPRDELAAAVATEFSGSIDPTGTVEGAMHEAQVFPGSEDDWGGFFERAFLVSVGEGLDSVRLSNFMGKVSIAHKERRAGAISVAIIPELDSITKDNYEHFCEWMTSVARVSPTPYVVMIGEDEYALEKGLSVGIWSALMSRFEESGVYDKRDVPALAEKTIRVQRCRFK